MKRQQPDNLNYVIGWLCGAVCFAAPLVAIVYLVLHRRRPAIQAVMIGIVSLACIVGARALMLAAGVQHKRVEWIGLNVLLFLAVPSFATLIASAISWPPPAPARPGRAPQKSGRSRTESPS